MSVALVELVETVGRALLVYADELRQSDVQTEVLALEPPADVDGLALGSRQQEMVRVLRDADNEGLTTTEICLEMGGYDPANGHMALRALRNRRVVEEVPGRKPIRWRLAAQYRETAEPYLQAAELVAAGEWTTYGDVSMVVRGDLNGSRAVGRAAAMLPHFPNPHRVLSSGGLINDHWKTTDSDEPNPEVCRQRLEAEGVTFDEHGRASREHYVSWDVLRERMGADTGEEAA